MSNWDNATELELEYARDAYDPGDPKHPDFYNTTIDAADAERKRLKEEGPMQPAGAEPTKALNAALAQAQGEFPPIARDKTVETGTYKFSYAELGTILAACRPVLAKHGLALTQQLEDNGRPALRTELRHKDGGVIGASWPLTRVPDSPQQLGSLLTYLRRYTIVAILGIATEDDDDAGQVTESSQFKAPKAKPPDKDITEPQRKKIYALKGKLTKAGHFTDEGFDEALEKRYGTFRVVELTRENARDLIDRLEALEQQPLPEPT